MVGQGGSASFLGRYEFTLDDKARVSLPAAFRKEADGGSFVMLQWRPPALTLFPQAAWADVRTRMIDFRRSSREAEAHVRRIAANAVEVTPDKQGRILIPAWLKEAAHLEETALVIGVVDRIEIWHPDRYEAATGPLSSEFDEFASRVFG